MNSFANLSAQQLRQAAGIKLKIDALQKKLDRILGGTAEAKAVAVPRKRRKMSATGRARIAAAARKRWAKVRAAKKKS